MSPLKSVWYACFTSSGAATTVVARAWYPWLAAALLTACSSDATREAATLPLPVGHYEGPISYQGTELRVALDLREATPGHLQADVSFPAVLGLEFPAAQLHYQEPQLRIQQYADPMMGIRIQAVREGDFLRGVLSWDSVRADFVWARRGEAAPRGYREQSARVQYGGRTHTLTLLFPEDTLAKHPAIALLPAATAAGTAARAARLAHQGFVTLVVPPVPGSPDSAAAPAASAALALLRAQVEVDSSKVGLWAGGSGAPWVAGAAAQAQPQAAFLVLEAAPANSSAEARRYQVLGQQRLPTLGLYAALDTSVQVQESARRLRTALGYRRGGMQVRTIAQATPAFLIPGRTSPDGQWQWPRPAPGYWEDVTQWLQSVTK